MSLIDLVYQSGEFVASDKSGWSDFWIAVTGAAIGSGATMLVFFLSIRHEANRELKIITQKDKDNLKFLRVLMQEAIVHIKNQIECYNDFLIDANAENFKLPSLNEPPLNDIDLLINRIDREVYFHSYVNHFGNQTIMLQEFSTMFKALNIFDDNFSKIKKGYFKVKESYIISSDTMLDKIRKLQERMWGIALSKTKDSDDAKAFCKVLGDLMLEDCATQTATELIAYYDNMQKKISTFAILFPEAMSLYHDIKYIKLSIDESRNKIKILIVSINTLINQSISWMDDLETSTERLLLSE